METSILDDVESPGAPKTASAESHAPSQNEISNTDDGSSDGPDRRPWLATPLDAKRPCIRVLTLQKGSDNESLACELSVVNLDEHPDFEVLSYVWGDPKITSEIAVGGTPFQATQNLIAFLHYLRLPHQDRTLWADAICINQADAEEKGHQIGLMTEIYRFAKSAHVWFGTFKSDTWAREIAGDEDYTLAVELDANGWADYERHCLSDLKYFVKEDGFKPIKTTEMNTFREECEACVFESTLKALDMMAEGDHLYTYPVFSHVETANGKREYRVNRSWLLIMDCIRWLLLRPWWSRVWTLQEAVLPKVDLMVHAPPHSFKLSRLLNGIYSMINHNNSKCCKWFGGPITTSIRDDASGYRFSQAIAVFQQRTALSQNDEGTGVPLSLVTTAMQTRKATVTEDHWYGLFGFLPAQWQAQSKSFPGTHTPTELFCQFSKLLYLECEDLTDLDLARRGRRSEIPGLPSWAIDLTSQRRDTEEDHQRWSLYNALPGQKFDCAFAWPELKTPVLSVQAIRVASVRAVAPSFLPTQYATSDILHLIHDWRKTYTAHVRPTDDDAFWRALFMDANVQMHWMSRRTRPLASVRLADIKNWFRAWTRTNDHRDLAYDRKAGGVARGAFHYRAVQRNAEKTRFFVTSQELPGMGPFDVLAGDEVYAVKGCRALVVLREVSNGGEGEKGWEVVGLCFVDRWMYGRAGQGRVRWETLRLV